MMNQADSASIKQVDLPFSNGLMSARTWKTNDRHVAAVPELGLHCYGETEQAVCFKLFTVLLKYYKQLKANESSISDKGREHLQLLCAWVEGIERRMMTPRIERENVIPLGRRR